MAKKRKASSNMQEVQNAAKTLFANIRFMSPRLSAAHYCYDELCAR